MRGTFTGDPDLDQAIEDLRPVAAELRDADTKRHDVENFGTLLEKGQLRERVADLKGRITVRAERLAMDPVALRIILRVEHEQRKRFKRKPSRKVLTAALKAEFERAGAQETQANASLTEAQVHFRRATAQRVAVAQACNAIGALA